MPNRLTRLTARTAARLPASAEARILRLRSYRSPAAPTIGLPAADRVLVLAPHPDDESLACGGTAALYARAGATVRVVVATDGEAAKVDLATDEIAQRRRQEVRAACRALGLAPPHHLGLPDGSLAAHADTLRAEIEGHLRDLSPDVVLLPWFGDGHRDHRAVNLALAAAATDAEPLVLAGETWTPAPITRLVDITTTMALVEVACRGHRTAGAAFDLEAMLALKRYRSVHGLRGRGWAEGFVAAPLARYVDLVEADEALHGG